MINYIKRYDSDNNDRLLNYIPNTVRCIINGESGCGKTNVLLNILSNIFESYSGLFNLIICSKTLEQPLYQGYVNETKRNYKKCNIICVDKIENINISKTDYKTIIVIDDMLGNMDKEDKKILISLFTTSRPRNISLFFLTQRYTQLDVICRQQCNYLITFRQGVKDLKTIYDEKLNFITFDELNNMFNNSINFYCIFCDVERNTIRDCIDIFKNDTGLKYYSNPDDLIEKWIILCQEKLSGNDNDDINDQIKNIARELEKLDIISF
ncbi:ATPase DNA packaging protein [Choristoneura biennis entomopoxvirus 'L' virophage]|nr:ATPase DNA packaging protein [Choristoneura biennis entomopoxvirus 'L' virophage]